MKLTTAIGRSIANIGCEARNLVEFLFPGSIKHLVSIESGKTCFLVIVIRWLAVVGCHFSFFLNREQSWGTQQGWFGRFHLMIAKARFLDDFNRFLSIINISVFTAEHFEFFERRDRTQKSRDIKEIPAEHLVLNSDSLRIIVLSGSLIPIYWVHLRSVPSKPLCPGGRLIYLVYSDCRQHQRN